MRRFVFQFSMITLWLILPLAAASKGLAGQPSKNSAKEAVEKTEKIIAGVIRKSYPELTGAKIKVKSFESDSNYFKSRFSITRYLTFQKMRYLVYVNPAVFAKQAPDDAVEAIIAHELAHVLYYRRKNRLELLGLVSLTDQSFTAKFERRADLEAIQRGYGAGLKEYRRWLYENIPAKDLKAKKRDYFSPEEIELILELSREKPEMFDQWRRKVPRDLDSLR